MNPSSGHKMMLAGFTLCAGLITWQEIHTCKTFPWPPRYVGAAITFGMLDLLSTLISPELAGMIGLGFVIAFIVNGKFDPRETVTCDHGGTPQPHFLAPLVPPTGKAT